MGKVIGKQGRIAKSIRTVMKAAAPRDGRYVDVDIHESYDSYVPQDSEG